MKRLLLILCLISGLCFADNNPYIEGIPITPGGGLCASCNPGDPADIFCEDFTGSTECATGKASVCQCVWTETEESGGTGTFATDGLTIAITSVAGIVEYTRDISAAAPQVYISFKLTVNSEGLADDDSIVIGGFSTNLLRLRQTSGSLYLDLDYNNEAGLVTGSTALSLSTEYLIQIAADESAETMQLWVDEVSQGSSAGQWAPFSLFRVGVANQGSLVNYTVKDIQVDDDTMP